MEAIHTAARRQGRRTKIIATVGPASWDEEVLVRLIEAGADVLRLNFSHADRDRHARTIESIRAAAQRAGREVAVLGDLPGPKLRIGELRGRARRRPAGPASPTTAWAPTSSRSTACPEPR